MPIQVYEPRVPRRIARERTQRVFLWAAIVVIGAPALAFAIRGFVWIVAAVGELVVRAVS